jgi:hypothetical protein
MNTSQKPRPWWTFGMVWMVVGGPALAVVASFITLWLAIARPDPVLPHDDVHSASLAPAQLAANHAQTGVPPTRH